MEKEMQRSFAQILLVQWQAEAEEKHYQQAFKSAFDSIPNSTTLSV